MYETVKQWTLAEYRLLWETTVPVAYAFGLVGVVLAINTASALGRRRKRANAMDPNTQKAREKRIVSDYISDAFDLAIEDKCLTAKEARYWSRLIGQHCFLPDLLPTKNSRNQQRPEIVKARIEALKTFLTFKRGGQSEAKKPKTVKPVVLPGDKGFKVDGARSLADMLANTVK